MQFYIDIMRETEEHTLPDAETFYVGTLGHRDWKAPLDCFMCSDWASEYGDERTPHSEHVGWYYWACFPGCLPDSDPVGPFNTEEDAIADARSY